MVVNLPPAQRNKDLGKWFHHIRRRIKDLQDAPDAESNFPVIVNNLADLRNLDSGTLAYLLGHTSNNDGGQGHFIQSSSLSDDNGTVVPGWQRQYTDNINAQWFGVSKDNPDNTSNFSAALTAAKSSGKNLFLPVGTYITDNIDYGVPGFGSQVNIIGEGRNQTTLQKKTDDGKPILSLGSPSSSNFIANISVKGITFKGRGGGTPAGVLAYDVVRSLFEDCVFDTSAVGLHMLGTTINNVIRGCTAEGNQLGIRMQRADSSNGAGDSNANTIQDCVIVNNTKWGVHFDGGRVINILNSDFEGNGTNPLGGDYGGLYIGGSSGSRHDATKDNQKVLNMSGCWFEANKGIADIWMQNGFNVIRDTYLHTDSARTTNDILVSGGKYALYDNYSLYSKTNNLLETSAVSSGNFVTNCDFDNISVDSSKTTVT